MSSTTQERPRETGRRLQWDRDVNLLKWGLMSIRIRTRDKWSMGRHALHHRRLWDIVHDH
jgi:hypothetical protein